MERAVVVALGDRKCVKLQRSVILMTPNDMPPLTVVPFSHLAARIPSSTPDFLLLAPLEPPRLAEAALRGQNRFTESTLKIQLLIEGG